VGKRVKTQTGEQAQNNQVYRPPDARSTVEMATVRHELVNRRHPKGAVVLDHKEEVACHRCT